MFASSCFRPVVRALLGIGFVAASAGAAAVPLTYSFTGLASGTLEMTSFSDASFQILLNTDTQTGSQAYSGTVSIGGLGTVAFLGGPAYVFFSPSFANSTPVNRGQPGVGFGGFAGQPFDIAGISGPAMAGYVLGTASAPRNGDGYLADGQFSNVNTSGGSLTVTAFDQAVFQAVVVPEPSIYGMMALGLGAIGFIARRRKAG
jgi:PEP-CTERM motif